MKSINPFIACLGMLLLTVLLIFLFEPGITGAAEAVAILSSFAAFMVFLIIGTARIARRKS